MAVKRQLLILGAMLKKTVLILLTCFSSALAGFGQEICNNGIDDDGNGLIDCYDPQCNGNPDCSDFFYGKPALTCTTNPTNPTFSLNTLWQSPMNVSARSTMMVGDMDGDGTIDGYDTNGDGINDDALSEITDMGGKGFKVG